jgi:hypothetical protein
MNVSNKREKAKKKERFFFAKKFAKVFTQMARKKGGWERKRNRLTRKRWKFPEKELEGLCDDCKSNTNDSQICGCCYRYLCLNCSDCKTCALDFLKGKVGKCQDCKMYCQLKYLETCATCKVFQFCMYCVNTCDICCQAMCDNHTKEMTCSHMERCVNCVSDRCEYCDKNDELMNEQFDEFCDRVHQEWWEKEFQRFGI